MAGMEEAKGLKGVIVGSTKVSSMENGVAMRYFGYPVADLAKHCCFEEVAYLILFKELPTAPQLKDFQAKIARYRDLPPALKQALERIPIDSNPMDVMRTGCSMLGTLEPELGRKPEEIATRLISCFASILLYWHHFVTSNKRITCLTSPEDSVALHFLKLLTQRAVHDPVVVRAIDVSLILYAEHEFNTSTFAARVTASTLSDFYSCIVSAIATLRGPLLGGANEGAMKMLAGFKNPTDALEKTEEMKKRKQLFMGFAHRADNLMDPRAAIIKEHSRMLAEKPFGDKNLFEISEAMEGYLLREMNITPSLDFYVASTYNQCGVPAQYVPGLYVFARTAGWAAHIFEQRTNNKLIRPSARYEGPEPRPIPKL